MKVSGKNPNHEFFKDICKVLTYNSRSSRRLKKLIFLTESRGAKKLQQGLPGATAELGKKLGFQIEVVEL